VSASPDDLLERLKDGDGDAGRELALAYLPVVRSLSLAATLEPEAAKAIAADALAALHAAFAAAADVAALPGVAAEAVRTAARARIGSGTGRRSYLVALPAEAAERAKGPALDLPGILGDTDPDEAGFMLLEAANRLPVRYRVPFLLTLLEGLPWASVADLTGLSPTELENELMAAHRLFEREFRFAVEGAQ
jgi:DNA-directed RNA polymerase specialized sigma24 family protein